MILIWIENKLKVEPILSERVYELSLRMEEIEIYIKEYALTKNTFWKILDSKSLILPDCARMICYRKKPAVA